MSKIRSSAGNLVTAQYENHSGGGSLYLMGSLFGVSVQKTSGTEVVENRESTYYSGAKYLQAPI